MVQVKSSGWGISAPLVISRRPPPGSFIPAVTRAGPTAGQARLSRVRLRSASVSVVRGETDSSTKLAVPLVRASRSSKNLKAGPGCASTTGEVAAGFAGAGGGAARALAPGLTGGAARPRKGRARTVTPLFFRKASASKPPLSTPQITQRRGEGGAPPVLLHE